MSEKNMMEPCFFVMKSVIEIKEEQIEDALYDFGEVGVEIVRAEVRKKV